MLFLHSSSSAAAAAVAVAVAAAVAVAVAVAVAAETEMVEWISALEGSIAKIVKQLAGIDDSSDGQHAKSSSSREKHRSSSSKNRDTGGDWAKQV